MQKLLSEKSDFQSYLDILKIPPVRSIRCNTLKLTPQDLKTRLENKTWKIKQPWKNHPEIMVVEGKIIDQNQIDKETINRKRRDNKNVVIGNVENLQPGELGKALEHLLGYYYIQELASMLPIITLNSESGGFILDLCSAPGSKTTQAAAEIKNTRTIIANEVSLGRIKILASNLERCGVTNTIITKKEGTALCKRLKKQNFQFDTILVDAPCSGEGTLRSSPKTYLMWNIKTIKNLPKIQKNLVTSALEILKPNGTLIYSTCTHAPEENEGVINEILKENKNLKLEKIKLPIKPRPGITNWEDKKYSKEITKCARIYPQDNNTEGFFIAKLKKTK
ncbi:MAG: RsmB/NOP family class I SAM-dependent RNA methyltransferase [Nanoarchaeota archaeon]|nr:RsmB/NOP family class I SAM-dependent RNA methyltransferase [Nanoarchaeota archaeon]